MDYDKLYDFEVKVGRLDEQLYNSWHKEEFSQHPHMDILYLVC